MSPVAQTKKLVWQSAISSFASSISRLSNLCVLFMSLYLTSCGYYWHLHGLAFSLKQTAKLNIMFALANLILADRPHLAA